MRYTEKVVACALLASATAVATSVWAEPLDPPAGPVAGTGATQIFEIPFTIDEPGSYRLARDVVASSGIGVGISIEADNVTLDLGGHSLNGASMGAEGILLPGERSNVTIRNGRIADWNNTGIWDASDDDTDVVVEDVTITDVGFKGVDLFQTQATVRDVAVRTGAGLFGIAVGRNSRVADSRVIDGGAMVVGSRSVVTGCVVQGSAGIGLSAGADAVIENTTVRVSGGAGVSTGPGAVIENTTVRASFAGVVTGAGSVVRGCVSSGFSASSAAQDPAGGSVKPRTGEPVGAAAHEWSVVTDRDGDERIGMPDAASEEGVGPDGFVLGEDSVIKDSVARNNAGNGISADAGSHIESCTASKNGESGVQVSSLSTVFKCTIRRNTGDGIVVEGLDNRVDSNTIAKNGGAGIVLNASFNRVVRNDLSDHNNIVENASNDLPPENDFTNPWTNFVD